MKNKIMVLPSADFSNIQLYSVPNDIEDHEAFRYATGLIASVQENKESRENSLEDIEEALEAKGFSKINFILGPELD